MTKILATALILAALAYIAATVGTKIGQGISAPIIKIGRTIEI